MGYGMGPGTGQPGQKPIQKQPKEKPQSPTAPSNKNPPPQFSGPFSLEDLLKYLTGKRR